MGPVPEIPSIISVDDHVIEPPHLFERWLPSKHRDAAPRVVRSGWVRDPKGRPWAYSPSDDLSRGPADFWWYEGLRAAIPFSLACAGVAPEDVLARPTFYGEMRPSYYDPAARLVDMTVNNVERSLCFPTFPRFCGQTFLEADDRELALACVVAYNDWMVEEWCGDSGGRLIPLCLIPLWDPIAAAVEVRRNAARGVRSVCFSELPSALGLPSLHDPGRHWDPLWAACDETATVVAMHQGSSSKMFSTSPDAPNAVSVTLTTINSQAAMVDWLCSGILARFPNLKIALPESQIGWMPFVLERLDNIYGKGNAFLDFPASIASKPSSYMEGRVYGCFFEDGFGLASRDQIGVRQITVETDFPHQDTTWPDTKSYLGRIMADLTGEEIYRITRGNAIEMLGLPVELPAAGLVS